MVSHGLNQFYSVFKSPAGDLLGLFGAGQGDVKCRELELNVLDCTDVYGHKGVMKQCRDLYDDFAECIYKTKQILRNQEMRKERMRQYYAGERTKENLYAKPPPLDAYWQTYLKDID